MQCMRTAGADNVTLLLQAFDADLFVADPGNLGGWAFADMLGLPKAMIQVPGFTPPLVRLVMAALTLNPHMHF